MQHMQFITAFIIRNRYRAIKSKIAITVCVRLKGQGTQNHCFLSFESC